MHKKSFYLICISIAPVRMNDSSLLQILDQSHDYNLAHDITGMLLYMKSRFISKLQGRFMHMIEGENTEVVKLTKR